MRRSKIRVYVHVVWRTWDRLPLLTPQRQEQAYRVIGDKCEELGATIIAIGGVVDHAHLLVQIPATLTIAELVKQVKGSSGHLLSERAREAHQFFKWQGAYGAFSVSPHDVDMIAKYIAFQPQHHADGTLTPEWEETDEPE